jgi:hypothetical protein
MGTGQDEIRNATGPIVEVVGAGTEACHLSDGGKISCTTAGMAPAGNDFIDLAFGSDSDACGLHANGSLDYALASDIPYPLEAIDAGGDAPGSEAVGCGLTHAGARICWGGAGVVPTVPPGPFARIEVSSTAEGVCGFRADSTLSCWHYGFRAGYIQSRRRRRPSITAANPLVFGGFWPHQACSSRQANALRDCRDRRAKLRWPRQIFIVSSFPLSPIVICSCQSLSRTSRLSMPS